MALWSGRFTEGADAFTQRFGASLPVDQRLYAEDIAGSIAHANMLAAQGIIATVDAEAIAEGLQGILADITSGALTFDVMESEDIHMAIEAELTRRVGDAGARLHTGRSRNDQVTTDTRLYAKRRAGELMAANVALREALIAQAEANFDVILPGYTHLQHAQPVLFSHHMLAYVQMLARDYERLAAARDAADACPLGAAALAGTTYPLDRFATAEALGFDHPIPNSLDAVSDRDFLLDLIYACSVSCLHLSRLCEEIVLWSSAEFGFITLSDAYSTGSSIMPQKKNPDFAELIRGKSGRVVGDLVALMMTLKSLPLAYNKDLQEDKEGAMDAADTLEDCDRHHDGERRRHGRPSEEGISGRDGCGRLPGQEGPALPPGPRDRGTSGASVRPARLRFGRSHAGRFQGGKRSLRIRYCGVPEPARHRRRPHHLRRHGPRSGTCAAGGRQGATRRFWSLVYCQSAFKRSLVNREFCCIPLRHKRLRLRRSFLYAVFRFGLCYNRATTTASDMLAYNFRAAVQLHRKPGQESICHSRFSCGLPVLKSLRLW